MKFENLRIKENITDIDLANVVDTAVRFMIRKNENEIIYEPYKEKQGIYVGITVYLLEGIIFEDNDRVYDVVLSNPELEQYIIDVLDKYGDWIYKYVHDIVDFRKQEYVHRSLAVEERLIHALDLESKLNESADKLAKKQTELANKQLKRQKETDKIMKQFSDEEIEQLLKNLSTANFDALNTQITKAYLNSDHYKKNLKVLEGKKNG